MKTQPAKNTNKILATVLLLALPSLASAAIIALNADDTSPQTSFNTGTHWIGGAAPSSANDYNTGGYQLRSPPDANNYTFLGASLTFSNNSLAGSGNGSFLDKDSAGSGSGRTLTINNCTNLAGALLRSGAANGSIVTLAGNHLTIKGTSAIWADQTIWIIDSPLEDDPTTAGTVVLTNRSSANSPVNYIAYAGTNSGFTGSLLIIATGANAGCYVQLLSPFSVPGNPAVFNPAQINIGPNGILLDTAGSTFNNPNGGFTFTGSAIINSPATTIVAEPMTGGFGLTKTGAGTLELSSANNTYTGGTTISTGTLQQGVANAVPGNTIAGDVTDNAIFDLNTFSATINGLNGSGTVDTVAGGTPTLTIGANGDSGTFSGIIQNSSGTLSLAKIGSGTETLSGSITYSGNTVVAGGTLNLTTAVSVPSTPGNLVVSNTGVLAINAAGGVALPANGVILSTNGIVNLTLSQTAIGISASGSLNFLDNATINLAYGTVTGNPSTAAINAAGGISTPGSNIVINLSATGLQPGTFTLIKYTGTALASIANIQVSPPPGVAATLVNNSNNDSIDLNVTSIPNQLAWNGVNGTSWDISTPNWTNLVAGGITIFQQYTNGSVVAGDSVLFDDTLTNDFVNPQPTNIVLNTRFYAFPVIENSTLPYSIAGAGGIAGVTSLTISNTGSLTLLTSNSFTGGVNLDGGALIITNDSALGASSGAVTLNSGTLEINGGVTNSRAFPMPTTSTIGVSANNTVRLNGKLSGAGTFHRQDVGTLILATNDAITGDVFLHDGTTIIDTGGAITNTVFDDVGVDTNDSATLILRNTGSFSTTSDFNLGDLGASVGTLYVSNTATLTMNAFYIGSANAAGSTAMGTVNQSGGTITEVSSAIGFFCIGGRTSASAVGTYNMSGGTLTANAGIRVGSTGIGTLNQSGGTINAIGGINIARLPGSFGTNNLYGGTLSTFNVASTQGTNAVFNLNGGLLQANFNPQTTTWFSGGILAYIQAGGAFVDSSNFNVTISVPLLAGSPSGGLTKKGTGTLTLSGTNTFTGPITNTAGTLILNSASTYAGATVVNAGTVQITSAPTLQGGAVIGNGTVLTFNQVGSAAANIGNLTFNGTTVLPGATLALDPTVANNPAVPLVNCSTLTLNGTNTISVPLESAGTLALIKYSAIAGAGNCTNLALPQGATGYLSNSAANSTLYAVVTSTGPGIFWTGTNSIAGKTNLWDISTSTNWVLGTIPTTYHQVVIPGDSITFNDTGSGTVFLSNNVGPTSLLISNNAKTYTFSGTGNISGPAGLLKLGSGTAIINLTNNNYIGATVISNGTLQVGGPASISSAANVVLGPNGTLELAGINQTAGELTGSGIVDDNNGDLLLTVGSSSGGTWNGTIQGQIRGNIALVKNGSGTWIVGGTNNLANGSTFTVFDEFNGGTTVITNGGLLSIPVSEAHIADGPGLSSAVVVAGGTLTVSNNRLFIGNQTNTSATLTVNSGTVVHGGLPSNVFGNPNQIVVGAGGGNGTLTVNGGKVLNSQSLWLGQGVGANGTLQLNGGLVQASQVTANATPASSTANFNGGTLQANTNSTDFIDTTTTANIQTGGLILDDGGFVISLPYSLQTDPTLLGGGLIKQGAGSVYLDAANTYTGTTLVTNGLLAGVGTVIGPVVVAPAGNLGAGDAGGIGSFTINNSLTLQGNATMRISKTSDVLAQDQVVVSGNANYGGVLTVTNITSDANILATTDTFQLFSVAGSPTGNFSSIAGSPGVGLAYSFNPTNGVLSIVTGIASNPTNITFSVSGNTLSLSWPADHLGWILQSQTNSLVTGLSTNWGDMAGTSTVTSTNITISPNTPAAFFRLRHP